MPDAKGRFVKGEHRSPATEFKLAQHWRLRKPHWEKAWLEQEYLAKGRSAADIAKDEQCTEAAILYWLHKHGIPRRSVSEARQRKYWGVYGKANGMYGRYGATNPHWKGGITAERQSFYSSLDWAGVVRKIWKRDKSRCGRCRREKSERFANFHIHHRVSFEAHDVRANIDNLILLCGQCHRWVHSKANTKGEFIGAFQVSMKGG